MPGHSLTKSSNHASQQELLLHGKKGLSDNFKGGGYFQAEAIDENNTAMTGNLDITAGGAMGPMVNSILKNFVPKTAEELTVAVANKIKEVNGVSI